VCGGAGGGGGGWGGGLGGGFELSSFFCSNAEPQGCHRCSKECHFPPPSLLPNKALVKAAKSERGIFLRRKRDIQKLSCNKQQQSNTLSGKYMKCFAIKLCTTRDHYSYLNHQD